jgi:predicted DNA-binding protein
MVAMPRTVVTLSDEQTKRLRRAAQTRGVSMAAIIREAIDEIPEPPLTDRESMIRRALDVSGRYRSGLHDVSTNMDDYLAEAFLA